eukprot:TRINITY_DN805_c0_g1_i1.p1 TRINITY_DN805_c0_g1~~TRINITY_DN805_c0_g1_i1.p1  ORF type:complete len:102 (+),score=6.95 TRINITY_DN805_c0_g1_i1:164-469(+)
MIRNYRKVIKNRGSYPLGDNYIKPSIPRLTLRCNSEKMKANVKYIHEDEITVQDLNWICSVSGVKGYGNKSKVEIIDLIKGDLEARDALIKKAKEKRRRYK